MAANSIRRGYVLRRCLYSADHWTEKYGPNRCVFNLKFGKCIFRTCGMGAVKPEVKYKRAIWMRAHVLGNHSGTAAREDKILVKCVHYSIVFSIFLVYYYN